MSNEITLAEAITMTHAYQNDPLFAGQAIAAKLNNASYLEIINQPGCVEVRTYFAKDAAGAATVGGAMALITGDDIVKSALGAGMNSISSNLVGKLFNTVQETVTKIDKTQAQYVEAKTQAQQLITGNPNLQKISALQAEQLKQAQFINDKISELEAT